MEENKPESGEFIETQVEMPETNEPEVQATEHAEQAPILSTGKRVCRTIGYVFFALALLFCVISACFLISTGTGDDLGLFVVILIAALGWFTIYPLLLTSLFATIFLAITFKYNKFSCILSAIIFAVTLAILVTLIVLVTT